MGSGPLGARWVPGATWPLHCPRAIGGRGAEERVEGLARTRWARGSSGAGAETGCVGGPGRRLGCGPLSRRACGRRLSGRSRPWRPGLRSASLRAPLRRGACGRRWPTFRPRVAGRLHSAKARVRRRRCRRKAESGAQASEPSPAPTECATVQGASCTEGAAARRACRVIRGASSARARAARGCRPTLTDRPATEEEAPRRRRAPLESSDARRRKRGTHTQRKCEPPTPNCGGGQGASSRSRSLFCENNFARLVAAASFRWPAPSNGVGADSPSGPRRAGDGRRRLRPRPGRRPPPRTSRPAHRGPLTGEALRPQPPRRLPRSPGVALLTDRRR